MTTSFWFCGAFVVLLLVVFVTTVPVVHADVYLHAMPGSNNRLNENTNNRRNANRLFDSQNNNRGGYNVGENCPNGFQVNPATGQSNGGLNPACTGNTADLSQDAQKGYLKFFEGSLTYIEWTNQHACGTNERAHCQLVLQYMCWPGTPQSPASYEGDTRYLRDGTQTNGNQPEIGVHEPITYYTKCQTRNRNNGLYTADQNVGNNPKAINTRQNPNGNRSGSECPEERDYYPYWHPSPWKDIAIFTDDVSRCPYYIANSMNKVAKNECRCAQTCAPNSPQATSCWAQNNEASCGAQNGCVWASVSHGNFWDQQYDSMNSQPDVECLESPWNRDNHLGDGVNGRNNYYWWRMPSPQQACGASNGEDCGMCAFRLRYNITTGDYDNLQAWQVKDAAVRAELSFPLDYFNGVDSKLDGDDTILMDTVTPPNYFENNPVVDMEVKNGLALAVNTAQFGRTFQDRSHQFQILSRGKYGVGGNNCILNVLRRGKRGNIVQVYPGVEYDFTPSPLTINRNTYINFQWTGSNTNPNGNDGQGRAGTDRTNMVQITDPVLNVPRFYSGDDSDRLFGDSNEAIRYATSGLCRADDGNCEIQETLDNAPAYFNGGLKQFTQSKTYYFMGTRNNNFSNRSEKGQITVVGTGSCEPRDPPLQKTYD